MKRLTHLEFTSCNLQLEGILALLATPPYLPQLTHLDLGYNWAEDLVCPADREHPILSRSSGMNSESMEESTRWARLLSLNLTSNNIGDDGIRVLAESPYLNRLLRLDLEHNSIGTAGCRSLASAPFIASLTVLNLAYNEIGDEGACALAESTRFAQGLELDLRNNGIGDSGARALAESPHLRDVSLDVSDNAISWEGVAVFKDRLNVKHLPYIFDFSDDRKVED